MKVLRIFDVSAFVHAGMVNRHAYLLPPLDVLPDAFRERRIYCGGTSMLWNILYQHWGTCDMVFCCDRRPTIKQNMYEGYKSSREHKPGVSKSKEVCEYILNDCGLPVLFKDGYEADDFIYSLVQEHKNSYDKIYIYTSDSDLYFLVSENVSIEPSSTRAKRVNMQNYTYTVRSNLYTPYNVLTFYKVLFGDKGDDIPPLEGGLAMRMREALDVPLYQKFFGDKETAMALIGMFGPEATKQGQLVYPLDVRVPTTFACGDKLRIAEWGNAFHNQYWKTGRRDSARIEECIAEMDKLGLAVDDNS